MVGTRKIRPEGAAGEAEAVAEKRAELWLQENWAAIESSNAYVEKNGLPLAKYRIRLPVFESQKTMNDAMKILADDVLQGAAEAWRGHFADDLENIITNAQRIDYDETADSLCIEMLSDHVVRDVSYGWRLNVGYSATGEIAEITFLEVKGHGNSRS